MESHSILFKFKGNRTLNLQIFSMISSDTIYSLVSPLLLLLFFLTRCMFNSTKEKNLAYFSGATLQLSMKERLHWYFRSSTPNGYDTG